MPASGSGWLRLYRQSRNGAVSKPPASRAAFGSYYFRLGHDRWVFPEDLAALANRRRGKEGLLTQNAKSAGYLATPWAGKSTEDDPRAPDTRLIIVVSSGSMP
jgi:hypothetical protein